MNDNAAMNRRVVWKIVPLYCLVSLTSDVASVAAQTLQLFGTWKLNVERSKLGGPPPRSQTVTFRPDGPDGVAGFEETVDANGTRTAIQYTAKPDGRDYPIIGPPDILMRADTISMSRRDGFTIVWTYKKGGKPVMSLPGVVSADGRMLTMTAGDFVLAYERQ